MQTVVEVFGILLVGLTALPLLRTTNRWVRMLDFPRMQVAVFLLLCLACYLYYWFDNRLFSFVWVGSVSLALFIQVRMIFPFTVLAPAQAATAKRKQPDRTFSMLIANVRMENDQKQKFLALVKKAQPDLVLVNEPDQAWVDQLKVLEHSYPYSIQQPQNNTYGMMFFSRLRLRNERVLYRVEDEIPSIRTEVEMPSGDWFHFYGVHPQPPTPSNDTEKREAELLLVGREVKQSGKPSLVAGDLNDVGWSRTTGLFRKISGMLDPRIGRGFFNTYNVFVPFFRYPLDHVFYSPHFLLVEMRRLPAFGSDHFPILISLQYAPQEQDKQAVERASGEEKQEARDLIQEGLETASNSEH